MSEADVAAAGGPNVRAERVAVFAGSFDPVTLGHVDLVRRALAFADRVVVAVAVNSAKHPLFTLDERAALVRDALGGEPRVEVRALDGLLVAFAERVGATLLLRGLRTGADFDYESGMAQMNRHVAPSVDTVFLAPSPSVGFVSSTLVREVARLGGSVDALVTPGVAAALRARFGPPGGRADA